MSDKPKIDDIFPLYMRLMTEAKARIRCVEMIIDGRTSYFSPGVARESCFLQLRMLCELIAVACVAAHENKATAQLLRYYEPHKIFAELAKLNASFYPQPVAIEILNGQVFRTTPHDNGALTKSELISLRNQVGDNLHKKPIKTLLKAQAHRTDFADIISWLDKIKSLLMSHRIDRGDGKNYFVCELSAPVRPVFAHLPNHSVYQDGGMRLLRGSKIQ
jgi:hypothetical protein